MYKSTFSTHHSCRTAKQGRAGQYRVGPNGEPPNNESLFCHLYQTYYCLPRLHFSSAEVCLSPVKNIAYSCMAKRSQRSTRKVKYFVVLGRGRGIVINVYPKRSRRERVEGPIRNKRSPPLSMLLGLNHVWRGVVGRGSWTPSIRVAAFDRPLESSLGTIMACTIPRRTVVCST